MLSSQGKILYALGDGPKSLNGLLSITGLSVGTIYYNIKELIINGFVIEVQRKVLHYKERSRSSSKNY